MSLHPPGPRGRDALALLRQARRDPMPFFETMAARHGDISMVRFGKRALVLLRHPDLVRELLVNQQKNFIKSRTLRRAKILLGEGLLTSEGPLHLRQRRLAQPAFHRERIASYADTMVAFTERTAHRWRDGDVVDVHAEMMRMTLAIAGMTLFGADVESSASDVGDALTTIMHMFDRLNHPFGPILDRLPTPRSIRSWRARARLERTVRGIIAARRASARDTGDLLSMLLLAQDAEGDGSGMSDQLVRDEVLTLFLAGHETTANALTWTWLLLADHPHVAQRLREEVRGALGTGRPSFDDVARLPFTRAVLAESMRLFPPAWVVGRQALSDCEFGGYEIPKGAMVFASQWLIHRDERWFGDPLAFDPDRWTPEREAALPRYAYFPFGAGPRKCIGESFAWTEGVLALATLARSWTLTRANDAHVRPFASITLRPAGAVPMRLARVSPA